MVVDATAAGADDGGTVYRLAFVDQKGFEQHTPTTKAALGPWHDSLWSFPPSCPDGAAAYGSPQEAHVPVQGDCSDELHQHVDIAVRTRLVSRGGTKDRQGPAGGHAPSRVAPAALAA